MDAFKYNNHKAAYIGGRNDFLEEFGRSICIINSPVYAFVSFLT